MTDMQRNEPLAGVRASLTEIVADGVHPVLADPIDEMYALIDLAIENPQRSSEISDRIEALRGQLDGIEAEALDRLRQVDGPDDENEGGSDEPPAGN